MDMDEETIYADEEEELSTSYYESITGESLQYIDILSRL